MALHDGQEQIEKATGHTPTFFSPSILRSLGYTAVRAQLFSCIPFACAFVVTVMLAIGSDQYGRRMPAALFSYVVVFAGFLVACLIPLSNPTARSRMQQRIGSHAVAGA